MKGSVRIRQAAQAIRLVWSSARGWTLLQAGSMLLLGLLPIVSLLLTRQVVDALGTYLRQPPGSRNPEGLLVWLPWILAVSGVVWICRISSSLIAEAQGSAVSNHVLLELQKKSVELDLAVFETHEHYDRLRLAQSEAVIRPSSMVRNLIQLGVGLLVLASVAGVLWMTQGILLPILLLAALPGAAVSLWGSSRRKQWRIAHSARERYAGYLHALLTGWPFAKEIRLSGNADELKNRSSELRNRIRSSRLRLLARQVALEMGADVLSLAAVFGGLAVIFMRLRNNAMTLGDLALLYGGFQRGKGAFGRVLGSLTSLYEDSIFLSHFVEFLELPVRIQSPARPRPVPERLQCEIRFENVTFRYPGMARNVLQNMDFTLQAGEHLALVGENGSGKTTLIKLLCRLYDPTEGRILMDGTDLREFDLRRLRGMFSVLFQDFVRYQMTVEENIRMGEVGVAAGDPRVEEAARQAGADAFIRTLPNGFSTQLGRLFKGGVELSEGQWQRLALSRAFVRHAPVVILDEPTSSLDARAERELLESFMKIIPGRTALVVSHRFSTVQAADRIVLLSEGRVLESGSHRELLRNQGAYADLFALHAR